MPNLADVHRLTEVRVDIKSSETASADAGAASNSALGSNIIINDQRDGSVKDGVGLTESGIYIHVHSETSTCLENVMPLGPSPSSFTSISRAEAGRFSPESRSRSAWHIGLCMALAP